MPVQVTLVRVLLGSPGDVVEDRESVRQAIHAWNGANGLARGLIFQPVSWDLDAVPELGDRAQEIINRQIVDSSDQLIALFWSRLGTPTGKDIAGTVEEINRFCDAGKKVAVYISEQNIPKRTDTKQLEALNEYQKKCEKDGLLLTYKTADDLQRKITTLLTKRALEIAPAPSRGDKTTFSTKAMQEASRYDSTADLARLQIQVDRFLPVEMKAIEKAVKHIRKKTKGSLRVLDLGCGDGYGTMRRFSKDDFRVTAFDKNANAIGTAKAKHSSKHIDYQRLDFGAARFKAASFDLVFASEFFHHLGDPRGAIQRAWEWVKPGGAMIVRGSDDGMKINYPSNPDLDFLLSSTNSLAGSSDRQYGRKVYTHLRGLKPKPAKVELVLDVESTADSTPQERVDFFDDNYSYRDQYAKILSTDSSQPRYELDRELYRLLRSIIDEQREAFRNDDSLLSTNVQSIGIALK